MDHRTGDTNRQITTILPSGVELIGNIINSNIDIIRKSYEAERIRNIVPDGTVPFQVESAQQTSGVALEFK